MADLTVDAIAARASALAPDLSESLDSSAYGAEVGAAILKLSQYEPQELYTDITGDGSTTLHTLTGWLKTNRATRLEYPINDADGEVAASSWTVLRSGSGWALRLSAVITSGEDARLWYEAHHTSDGTDTTVDETMLEPVARFCAAIVLRRFATRFLHSKRAQALGGSELIDLRSQAKEATDLAKLLDREALELLGVVQDDAVSSGAGGDGDMSGDVAIEAVVPPWESIGL